LVDCETTYAVFVRLSSNLRVDDFDHRCLVVQSGWQGAAEAYLIHLFKPAWNNETGICFGLGKHGDDPGTRAPWDTVHRGREWAHRDSHIKDSRPIEEILVSLRNHFATTEIYQDLDSVIKGFFDELKQL
jgi:Eco29kI restriction endonuclease